MKTIIRTSFFIILATLASKGWAQSGISLPCGITSTVITATNSLGLSSPSYSLNPGGITSAGASFTVSPDMNTGSTSYTLYTTGTNSNSAVVTTSNTVYIQLNSPTLAVSSVNMFNLGCGNASLCSVNLTGDTNPVAAGAVTYAFIAPGSSTTTAVFSNVQQYSVTVPGNWLAGIKDLINGCISWSIVTITQNTTSPTVPAITISNILTCANPVTTVQVAPDPNLVFIWQPWNVISNSITITSTVNPGSPIPAITRTLEVADPFNACRSYTVLTIDQNIYSPNASISGPSLGTCPSSVTLVNTSTSGIPPGTFPTSAPVVALLWQGPSPQPTLALNSSYVAQTSGIYTMTAMDNNNGCIQTATYNVGVGGAVAAFVHTLTSGTATFNDASTGTTGSTIYFWDFGDGTTSTQQNPSHTYVTGGAYLVKFKVAEPGLFCADSVIQSVNVSGIPCVANSGFAMAPTATAQVWNVIPSYPWNVTTATWYWGDGSSSNTLYASHQYSAAGLYNICLSVTISCAGTSSTCTSYNLYRVTESALMLKVNVTAPELVTGLAAQNTDEQLNWEIVPNPNNGDFILNLKNTKAAHIVICDLTGRMVQEQYIEQGSASTSVNANQLPAGMYFVSLESDKGKLTKRMVVNH